MSNIDHKAVVSSNLSTVGHDPGTNTLHVTFKNGRTYQYGGVTADQHAELMAADSKGSHLNKHIIPKHKVVKAK